MFHVSAIKNWFKGKAADFNKIAEYLNNLCGDGYIDVVRPDMPSSGAPPMITLDMEKLRKELDILQENVPKPDTSGLDYDISSHEKLAGKAPSEVKPSLIPAIISSEDDVENAAGAVSRIGSSARAAREDHSHLLKGSTALPLPDAGEGSSGFYVTENGQQVLNRDIRVALANHVHPLNVGTTSKTYAAGNHVHSDLEARILAIETGGGGGGTGVDPTELQSLIENVATNTDAITDLQDAVTTLQESDATNTETITDHETRLGEAEGSIEELEGEQSELGANCAEVALLSARMLTDFYETTPTVVPDADGFPTDCTEGKPQLPPALVESEVAAMQPEAEEGSVGESKKFAYSDHVHPERGVVAPASTASASSGTGGANGLEGGSYTFDKTSSPGLQLLVATRIQDIPETTDARIYFRRMTITGDGRIASIGGEESAYAVAKAFGI